MKEEKDNGKILKNILKIFFKIYQPFKEIYPSKKNNVCTAS